MAPMLVPGGSLISCRARPTTLEVRLSPCATASMASAAPQRMHHHLVAAPLVGEQTADGGLLWRNGDVDVAALDQIDISGAIDQRHHLARAEPLRQHRRQDIGLIRFGSVSNFVVILYVFFQ